LEGVWGYFVALDVLAPSFMVAMFFGWVFSKIYPSERNKTP